MSGFRWKSARAQDERSARDGKSKFAPLFRKVDPPDFSKKSSTDIKQANRWRMITPIKNAPSTPQPRPAENEMLPNLLPFAKAGVRTGLGWACPYCQRFFKKEGLCSKKHLAKEHGDYSTLRDPKMRDYIALKVQKSPENSSLSPTGNQGSSLYSTPTNISPEKSYQSDNSLYGLNSSTGHYTAYPHQPSTFPGSAGPNSGARACMYDSPPGNVNPPLQTFAAPQNALQGGAQPIAMTNQNTPQGYQQYNQPMNTQSSNLNVNNNVGKHSYPGWSCQQCGKSFQKVDSGVHDHLSKDHNWTDQQIEIYFQRKFLCSLCGKQCDGQADLHRHKISHNPPRKHSCELCGAGFRVEKFLTHHLLNIHDVGLSDTCICLVCQEILPGPIELQEHLCVEHGDQKKYQCSKCDKCFVHRFYLEKHEMLHESKGHVCEVCNKSFTRPDHLRTHVLKHTGIRPFECQICEQRFKEASSLRRHTRVHLDIKPYQCPVCSNRYIRMDKLKIHVNRHHPDSGLDLSDHTKFKVVDPDEEHILKVFLGPKAANSAVAESLDWDDEAPGKRRIATAENEAWSGSEADELEESSDFDDSMETTGSGVQERNDLEKDENEQKEVDETLSGEVSQGESSQGVKRKLDSTESKPDDTEPTFTTLQPVEKRTKDCVGDNPEKKQ